MWKYINRQQKAFVVCPKIEEEDCEVVQESDESESVVSVQKQLQKMFGNNAVLRVDGSLSKEKQTKAMEDFLQGNSKILVATTVIEVGVDVKRANTMVILGADKFGLSSLHQLRGRIGRDGNEAHCFIVLSEKMAEKSKERLDFFRTHTSGFEIAEYDYKTRGAGDAFGTKQSGEVLVPFSAETLSIAKQIANDLGKQKSRLVANN